MTSSAETTAGATSQAVTSQAATSQAATFHAAAWPSAAAGDGDALAKARWEMLNLVQWLARIANSYVPEAAPEERVLLSFDAGEAAFVTRPFSEGISLAMRLATLEMQFREGGKPMPHRFDPEERSPSEVEAWLLVELLHRGLDCAKFSKTLPYTVSGLMAGDAEDHSPQSCAKGLAVLAAWYCNAAEVLAAAARAAGTDARVLCRPQTLDLTCAAGAASATAGFGFSPGNARRPEPFFYVGPESGNARAVLSASEVLSVDDPAAMAKDFIAAAAARRGS
jgi:hypothetical protein